MNLPRLQSATCVTVLPSGNIQVRNNVDSITFDQHGAMIVEVLRLLDGTHSEEQILERVPSLTGKFLEGLIGVLAGKGLVSTTTDAGAEPNLAELAIANAKRLKLQQIIQGLEDIAPAYGGCEKPMRIGLFGDCDHAAKMLSEYSFEVVRYEQVPTAADFQTDDVDVLVMINLQPQQAQLYSLGAAAIQNNIPILFCSNEGARLVIGPFMFPGESGCIQCFMTRYSNTRRFTEEFQGLYGNREVVFEGSPAGPITVGLLSIHASQQMIAFSKGLYEDLLVNEVRMVPIESGDSQTHTFVRLPRCTLCGRTSKAPEQAIRDLL